MKIAWALTAYTCGPGKHGLDIEGLTNAIEATSFPVHVNLALVTRLDIPLDECSQLHELRTKVSDDDGRPVAEFPHVFSVPQNPWEGRDQVYIVNSPLLGLVFPKAGTYQFELDVDGEVLSSFLFDVLNSEGVRSTD